MFTTERYFGKVLKIQYNVASLETMLSKKRPYVHNELQVPTFSNLNGHMYL